MLKNSLNKTGIRGIVYSFRKGLKCDTFRVQIYSHEAFGRKPKWISPKVDPRLREINEYLKNGLLHQDAAEADSNFLTLKHRLFAALQKEYYLKEYNGRQRLTLKSKAFNYEDSLSQFFETKMDTAVANKHRAYMVNVWFPFFLEKGCSHPSQFIKWRKQAKMHVKTVKKKDSDEKYAAVSWASLTGTLNEYMKFLLENGDISEDEQFSITVEITREARKRGLTSQSRKLLTYSVEELRDIKKKIDARYSSEFELKLRAYGLLFGVYTGLRRGNILGLTVDCLYPEAEVPYFVTKDNIVDGWSRAHKGALTIENSTKSFVGIVTLPMLQPEEKTVVAVAKFLKANLDRSQRLVSCGPSCVRHWWRQIADDCGFKFLTPHDWKHSYATIGAMKLKELYQGNPYLLQKCCMHEKYETTLGYVRQTGESFLQAFKT